MPKLHAVIMNHIKHDEEITSLCLCDELCNVFEVNFLLGYAFPIVIILKALLNSVLKPHAKGLGHASLIHLALEN